MHPAIRLYAVDLRNTRVVRASKEVQPLTCAGADVETDTAGGVAEERHDFWGGVLRAEGTEPGPEGGEPFVLEVGKGSQSLVILGGEEVVDCGDDEVGGVEEETEGVEEGERAGFSSCSRHFSLQF